MLDWPFGDRIAVVWPEGGASLPIPRIGAKLMLLLGLVALDCLGGAGQLIFSSQATADGLLWRSKAMGERAALAADMAAALSGQAGVGDLSAKTAPAAYAMVLAEGLGARISSMAAPEMIRQECLIPATS